MILTGRELDESEKAAVYDQILERTLKWTNCPIKDVDARNYQGRCGRIGWDVRNILYDVGAIIKDEKNGLIV